MNCTIASPKKTTNYSQLSGILLPTYNGQIQVLPNHAEAFFLLKEGEVILSKKTAPEKRFPIGGGIGCVKDDQITLILQSQVLSGLASFKKEREQEKESATNDNHRSSG